MANVLGIADEILIAGFDEHCSDYNGILKKVVQICRQSNLKLNKINIYLGIQASPSSVT